MSEGSDELHERLPEMGSDELRRLRATIGSADADDSPSVPRPRRRPAPPVADVDVTDDTTSLRAIGDALRKIARTMADIADRLAVLERRDSKRDETLDARIAEMGRAIANVAERRLAMIELQAIARRGRLDDINDKLDKLLGN